MEETPSTQPTTQDEPRRRGRPRKDDATPASATPAPAPAPVVEEGTVVTSLHADGAIPPAARLESPSYHAGSGHSLPAQRPQRPPMRREPRDNQVIDPRALAAQAAGRPRPQAPGPRAFVPELPNPNGFIQPKRALPRRRIPSDGGGMFLQRQTDGTPTFAPLAVAAPDTIRQPKPNANPNETVKIIPLGGLEEIGKNMTVFEYKDDILIVDMGFLFPDADMPGVDYIIPDVSYLEEKKHKIRGAIITHGHLDHIGAIPYLIEKLGFPTMYGTPITMGLVKNRLEEFNLLGMGKIATIDPTKDVLQLGAFTVRPFRLIHSIPGSIGLEIETPNGRISYCTDWKFDYAPAEGQQVDLRELAAVGTRGVDLLFSDSTNATKPGHTISEKVIEAELDKSVAGAEGRIIIAMFASSLARVQQTINIAAKHNRKVVVVGRSMQKNIEMMVSMRAMTVPPNTMISDRELTRFNDNQIMVLTTGAQGEERAGLNRMASGEHKTIKVRKGDTVVISASPIPGNEKSVNGVMNLLYKAGATVIYNVTADVHSSGHAYAEDLKLMLALMRPNYFLPLHGERPKLVAHGKLAEEVGVNPNNVIIADNGSIVEMDHTGRVFLTESHVPAGYVMVDGLGVGDVGTVVIRDRQVMAKEGVFVTISVFNKARKQFIGSPDIISRGFIYMRENERFVNDIRSTVRNFLASHEQALRGPDDMAELKNDLRSMLEKLLREKTEREPMVIPVVIEI